MSSDQSEQQHRAWHCCADTFINLVFSYQDQPKYRISGSMPYHKFIYLTKKDKLLFGHFYRSPTNSVSSDENNVKLNTLIRMTLALDKDYTYKCLVGYFNYNLIKWKNRTTLLNSIDI